jgi:ABC-2 type transport system permease protein
VTVETAIMRRMWNSTRRAYPWSFFVGTILTGTVTMLLAYLTFRLVSNGKVGPEFVEKSNSDDYLGYVALGAITFAFLVRVLLWTSRALVTEEREQTLLALLVSPIAIPRYLVGQALFATLSTVAESVVLLGFAFLLGVRIPLADPVLAVVGIVVFAACVGSMAAVLGVLMLKSRETYLLQNTWFLVVGLLGGFSFPTAYLPAVVAAAAQLIPVTSGLRVLRACLAGDAATLTSTDFLIALVTALAWTAFAAALYPIARQRAIARSL